MWGLFNRVWLSLLVFVPVIGLFVPFVLLFKGREWAWQNKTWESVEHFNRVQRNWTIAGLIPFFLAIVGIAVAVMRGVSFSDGSSPNPAEQAPPPPSKPASAPAPRPAAAPAPSTAAEPAPKPAVAVAVEPPKETAAAAPAMMTVPAVVAVPPAGQAPAPAAARAEASAPAKVAAGAESSAPAPKPRVNEPRARPLPTAATPAAEGKVHTPRYNDLMTAVLKPDREGVAELLDMGRWIEKPDSEGVTPLQAAVRNRDSAMTELLLKRGANAHLRNERGLTASDFARLAGRESLAARLQPLAR